MSHSPIRSFPSVNPADHGTLRSFIKICVARFISESITVAKGTTVPKSTGCSPTMKPLPSEPLADRISHRTSSSFPPMWSLTSSSLTAITGRSDLQGLCTTRICPRSFTDRAVNRPGSGSHAARSNASRNNANSSKRTSGASDIGAGRFFNTRPRHSGLYRG